MKMFISIKHTILVIAIFISLDVFANQNDQSDIRLHEAINITAGNTLQQNRSNPDFDALLKHYQHKPNLFISVDKHNIDEIKKSYPDEINEIIATADLFEQQSFIFRYKWDMEKTSKPFRFDGEIDWQAEPWGDPEWTFMLNRHRYWLDLGLAYFVTGNEKYASSFVKQLEHWIDNNPLDDEHKKTSWRRIEAGFRAEHWIKAFEYFKFSPAMTAEIFGKFLKSLDQHAIYLNSQYTNFSRTSNWGVIEFTGLYYISQYLDDSQLSDQWASSALEKLSISIDLQVLDDGSHWLQQWAQT